MMIKLPVLFLSLFLSASTAAYADPSRDPFTEFCNSVYDSIMKRVNSASLGPIGLRPFMKEAGSILERQIPKGAPKLASGYMELSYREWAELGDPAFHLTVLQFPVPEAAINILGSALENRVSAEQVRGMLEGARFKDSPGEILNWVARLLEHPERKDGNLLKALVDQYKSSILISKDRIKYLTGIPIIPEVQPGHVRMYKGSNFFKGPAVSQSQAGKAPQEVPDGGLVFMDQSDANTHSVRAEAFHPDGVSVSTDKTVPINYGSHIRIYDVPREVVEKLPWGARGLSEYVFKYSVPERYRIKTLPKATYLEYLKQEGRRAYSYGELVRQASRNTGVELLNLLDSKSDPILIRGRALYFSSLISERTATLERHSIQEHVLRIFEQSEKYMNFFPWHEMGIPPNVDVKSVLNFSFAVHDLGKPLAAELRTPHQELSAEILVQMMHKAGFTKAEVELGRALVGNDVIGSMLQGVMTPQEAFEKLVEISKQTNLVPRDFFRVQSYFHAMDASSYPDLAALFTKEGGMLVPKNEKFRVLRNLFENVEINH
jgi:hypothetical protein